MKTLSLKLDQEIFEETETIIKNKNIPRNRYINQALEFFNNYQKRKTLADQFKIASELTKESSMEILQELDQLIDYNETQ
jgi:metal-responsive CopG/Arc/MetJ family transcriptional regulator